MNYLIRNHDRLERTLFQLGLSSSIDIENVKTLDDVFLQIQKNENKAKLIDSMIRELIFERLRNVLTHDRRKIITEIKINSILSEIIPKHKTMKVVHDLSKITQWKLPVTAMTKTSTVIALVILFSWCIIIFTIFSNYIELLLVTFNFFSAFFFILLLLPGIILIRIVPIFFDRHEFYELITVGDLVEQIYRLNQHIYIENNYYQSKKNIYDLFGPF